MRKFIRTNILLRTYCVLLLLACNQIKEEQQSEITENPDLSQQDNLPQTPQKVSSITFDKIKDRFLHQNLEKAGFQDSLFYENVVGQIDSSQKYFIYKTDLEKLGIFTLDRYKNYQPQRKFLYSQNEFQDGYLIGLASASEHFSNIDYIFCDKKGIPRHFLFSLGRGGDAAVRTYHFAFLGKKMIEIHELGCIWQDCDYKKYNLKLIDNNQKIITDTLEKIQTRYGHDLENLEKVDRHLFSEILKKYGLWTEHWGL